MSRRVPASPPDLPETPLKEKERGREREKLVAAFVLMRCSCAAYPTAMALNQLPSNSGSWLNFQKLRGEILKR